MKNWLTELFMCLFLLAGFAALYSYNHGEYQRMNIALGFICLLAIGGLLVHYINRNLNP